MQILVRPLSRHTTPPPQPTPRQQRPRTDSCVEEAPNCYSMGGRVLRGVTRALLNRLGPAPVPPSRRWRGGSSTRRHGQCVDEYVAAVVNGTKRPRVSRDALAVLQGISDAGLTLRQTQVPFGDAARGLVAVVDGVATTARGERVLVEWKTGHSYRYSRQQRLNLPHMTSVYDNARSRALLQLAMGMHFAGVRRGLVLFANKNGRTTALWLPRSLPIFFMPGAANDILDAFSSLKPSELNKAP